MSKKSTILVTATKTGGHLLPAVSVGKAISRLQPDIKVHIATSGAEIETTVLQGSNLPVHVIRSGGLKGTGHFMRLANLGQLPLALVASLRLLKKLRPAVVAGFGGFTTGPVMLAAYLMGIPTAILEANSIPGLTNKLSGKFVNRVFISFKTTLNYFPKRKTELTGTPVRQQITFIKKGKQTGPARHILVFGGSQGAQFLNETMPKILAKTARQIQGLTVLHQTGKNGVNATMQAYKEAGVDATVSEYMPDMASTYKWADFVVARSGAGTIAELIETGLPSLLVPFPLAADDHQYYNALELKKREAAMLVRQEECDIEYLSKELTQLLTSADKLNRMAEAVRAIKTGNAAEIIAQKLLKMAGYK